MNPRVGCVVLAAGQSRRFGSGDSKLLLPLAGKPLLQHAIDTAAQSLASSCTLVVGAYSEETLRAIDTRRCAVILNDDWRQGIASSIRAGLAQHADDEACIFMVADQPFVVPDDLNNLIRCYMEHRTFMVALRAASIWGSPMLFPQSDFPALRVLQGDAGAKGYALRHIDRVEFIESARTSAFADIDTPEDYERFGGLEGLS